MPEPEPLIDVKMAKIPIIEEEIKINEIQSAADGFTVEKVLFAGFTVEDEPGHVHDHELEIFVGNHELAYDA